MIGNSRTSLFHSQRNSVSRQSVLITVLCLCVTSIFSGCESNSQVLNRTEKPNEDRCDELVRSALDMMRPDRLGITSDTEAVTGALNQWSSKCAPSMEGSDEVSGSINPEIKALLNGLISPEGFNLSVNNSYLKRDVEHIRDCLLYKEMVDSADPTPSFSLDPPRNRAIGPLLGL